MEPQVILKEKEIAQAVAWIDGCKALVMALYDLGTLKTRILAGGATFLDADIATDPRTHHTTVAQLVASFSTVSAMLDTFNAGGNIQSIEVVLRD